MNEFSNAHEAGKLIRYREQAARDLEITAAIDAGKFAVVGIGPAYCPFTDATTGQAMHLIALHSTREEAETEAATLCEDCPDEIDFYVLPKLPRETAPQIDCNSDIPF